MDKLLASYIYSLRLLVWLLHSCRHLTFVRQYRISLTRVPDSIPHSCSTVALLFSPCRNTTIKYIRLRRFAHRPSGLSALAYYPQMTRMCPSVFFLVFLILFSSRLVCIPSPSLETDGFPFLLRVPSTLFCSFWPSTSTKVYSTLAVPMLTHGLETWALRKANKKRMRSSGNALHEANNRSRSQRQSEIRRYKKQLRSKRVENLLLE